MDELVLINGVWQRRPRKVGWRPSLVNRWAEISGMVEHARKHGMYFDELKGLQGVDRGYGEKVSVREVRRMLGLGDDFKLNGTQIRVTMEALGWRRGFMGHGGCDWAWVRDRGLSEEEA